MKSLTKAGTRAVCAGLVVLAAVGWSCSKQDEPSINNHQTVGAIVQARSFYESTATPLTKTVADQSIAIKPLPGEMTPLWDRAAAAVLSDGTTAWVDVPITAGVTYTAVRGGVHHHEAGEECGHDHSSVQAVQKLTIHTAADGTKQSLIATIVPETDCNAVLNDFSSADGLAGFSGFVSWHDLTGKLIRVTKYENGTKTRSVEPDGNNEVAILEVVDNAVLYPVKTNPTLSSIATKAIDDTRCNICGDSYCKNKNDITKHCTTCGKYNDYDKPFESKCICARCGKCGKRFKGDMFITNTCSCGSKVQKYTCSYCQKLLCNHILYGADFNYVPLPQLTITVHTEMLKEIFSQELSFGEFKYLNDASHLIDKESQNSGNEYLHGMYVPEDNYSQGAALAKMRNHFIHEMKDFAQTKEMLSLGEGFHPILDTYVEMRTRVDMLNYYTYANLNNVVHGMNASPYIHNPVPCTEAVMYIFNALKALPSTASDTEVGAVFDQWVSMVQGGAGKPDLWN